MHTDAHRLCRSFLRFNLGLLLSATPALAAKPAKSELREQKREMKAGDPDAKPGKRDDAPGDTAKSNSDGAQSRGLVKLREQLQVTDEGEWAVIAERVSQVDEIRRNSPPGNATGRLSGPAGDKGKRPSGADQPAFPERAALRAAVTDGLPDAEVKVRLARLHEAYRQYETRLTKAQADLRAVLTIRQEAVVVMAGLIPP